MIELFFFGSLALNFFSIIYSIADKQSTVVGLLQSSSRMYG